jgi:predicted alpha/beta superfamily hydrolase
MRLLLAFLFALVLLPAQSAELLSLPQTAVHWLDDAERQRRYPVWVDLPAGYAQAPATRRYAVVVVADAPYALPLTRVIRTRLGAGGQNIEDFILVGLAYAEGDTPRASRSRDYTPSSPKDRRDMGEKVYGEGSAYARFVAQQVLPLIDREYRSDPKRRTFIGHSYGALLGLILMREQAGAFGQFVLGSPSLWFDAGLSLQLVLPDAKTAKAGKLRVWMAAGAYEQPGQTARHAKRTSIVADMRQLETRLRRAGHEASSRVIPDEDHLSVQPVYTGKALLWALPGAGPYNGH